MPEASRSPRLLTTDDRTGATRAGRDGAMGAAAVPRGPSALLASQVHHTPQSTARSHEPAATRPTGGGPSLHPGGRAAALELESR